MEHLLWWIAGLIALYMAIVLAMRWIFRKPAAEETTLEHSDHPD
jgi:hypothetical protein